MRIIGKILSFAVWVVLAYFLFQKGSVWYKESKQAGQVVITNSVRIFSQDGAWTAADPLPERGKKVIIFWATWCGPCTLELGRVQNWVEKHEAFKDSILAVSLEQDQNLVSKTVADRKYKFAIGIDPQGTFAEQFHVMGTPTTIFIKDKKVVEISSGLTLLLERKLTSFLQDDE